MSVAMRCLLRNAGRSSLFGLLLCFSLPPAPARADWLILATGQRIETKGHWTVKGKQVVYTGLDKALRSIRLSEVNLPESTRVSAAEPSGKGGQYLDLGAAPDIADVKLPPVEFNRLNAWISNPNAPRVSGTVSAPGLQVSEEDLAREGLRILQDPEGAEAELMQAASRIDDQYKRCREVHNAIGDGGSCEEDYSKSANELANRVNQAYAAVSAARNAAHREEKMEDEEAAESRRVERERAQDAEDAKRAAESESPPEPPDN
jgi:hypothetical protein